MSDIWKYPPSRGSRDYLASAFEDEDDSVDAMNFLQRKHSDCDFLEVAVERSDDDGVMDQDGEVVQGDESGQVIKNGGVTEDYEVAEIDEGGRVIINGGVLDRVCRSEMSRRQKTPILEPEAVQTGNADGFCGSEMRQKQKTPILEPEVVQTGTADDFCGRELRQKTPILEPEVVQTGNGDCLVEFLINFLEQRPKVGEEKATQVPKPPPPLVRAPIKKQDVQKKLERGKDEINHDPVEILLDDGNETSVNIEDEDGTSSNNEMEQNWSILKDGKRPGVGKAPLYKLNPNDFPNDPKMQQRIRASQALQKRHSDIRQYIMETGIEIRELRKWNSDLRAKVLELVNCGCVRANKVEVSELLSRKVAETPPLNRRYYGELELQQGQQSPPSSPTPAAILPNVVVEEGLKNRPAPLASAVKNFVVPPPQKIGNGVILPEYKFLGSTLTFQPPFINTGNGGPPPQKILKADIMPGYNSLGSTLAVRPTFINTGNRTGQVLNRGSGSNVVTYQSQSRITEEQKQRVQNMVGSLPGGGHKSYGNLVGPFKLILPNNLNDKALMNCQTPATAPTVSKMFFAMKKN